MTPRDARVLDYMSSDLTASEWADRLEATPSEVVAWCRARRLPLPCTVTRREDALWEALVAAHEQLAEVGR